MAINDCVLLVPTVTVWIVLRHQVLHHQRLFYSHKSTVKTFHSYALFKTIGSEGRIYQLRNVLYLNLASHISSIQAGLKNQALG